MKLTLSILFPVIAVLPSVIADNVSLRGRVLAASDTKSFSDAGVLETKQDASCSAYAACAELSGSCCPTIDYVFLDCCKAALLSDLPSDVPSSGPSYEPTLALTDYQQSDPPSDAPSQGPALSDFPSDVPSSVPSYEPTLAPTDHQQSDPPSDAPSHGLSFVLPEDE